MQLPDYSEWLDAGKLGSTETDWATAGFHHTYAAHIALLRSRYKIEKILEIGCGTGWVPSVLSHNIQYMGVDKNDLVLDKARSKNIATRLFLQGDIREIHPGYFVPDLVCSFAVLKHFSLDEWNSIFDIVVSFAPIGLFTMSIANENRDDGVDFHHSWITKEFLHQALVRNKRELLYSTITWKGETWEKKIGEEWIFAVKETQ